MEGDAEAIFYGEDDEVAEGEEIGGRGLAGGIGEGESVAGGDAGAAAAEAFGKAGTLDQPGSGDLDLDLRCGPVGDIGGCEREDFRDVRQGFGGDDRILEEGAGGTGVRVWVGGVDEHAFAVADGTDGVVNVEWGGVGGTQGSQVGVAEVGLGLGMQAEADRGDDVAVAVSAVEEAGAVGEAALGIGEGNRCQCLQVKRGDLVDALRHLLAIGTDVLDRGTAGKAGDSCEAFHAGDSLPADFEHEGVPISAGGNVEEDGAVQVGANDRCGEGDVEDESGKAGVRHDEVGAPAEREDRKMVGAGERDRFKQIGVGMDGGEEAGSAAELERGVRG